MGVMKRPPKWDVTESEVGTRADPEMYRRVNLVATLTWGIPHRQLYRAWKFEKVLDYLLHGTTITTHSLGTTQTTKLQGTIQNAFEDGYFYEGASQKDVEDAITTLAQIPITGTDIPVAQLINLEHFYCGDCSQKSFPAEELSRLFETLRAAGLELEFFDRFKPGPKQSLGPDPGSAWEVERLLATFGEYTIAQTYYLGPADIRLIQHVPYIP